MEESVVVRSLQLPEVRTAVLVGDGVLAGVQAGVQGVPAADPQRGQAGVQLLEERIVYKRAPPPPPRRVSLLKYEEASS